MQDDADVEVEAPPQDDGSGNAASGTPVVEENPPHTDADHVERFSIELYRDRVGVHGGQSQSSAAVSDDQGKGSGQSFDGAASACNEDDIDAD